MAGFLWLCKIFGYDNRTCTQDDPADCQLRQHLVSDGLTLGAWALVVGGVVLVVCALILDHWQRTDPPAGSDQ